MAGSGGDDQKYCGNCKRDIAAANFVMHEVHCRRNIVLCSICDEPVARSELDDHISEEHTHCPECNKQVRPADLASHIDSEHGSQMCPNCSEEIANNNFEHHSKNECLQRKIPCQICELELPMVEMAEHEQWCGSRTELCTMCERYIKLKDLDLHISSSCQLPEPEKKEKTPLTSDQDLSQRLKAYEFRREELNRALGLDGQWNRIPPTLREQPGYMERFHPDQEEMVEAGNQMLRIEQMADAMVSGQAGGYVDRYNRRREMFGESDEEPEDVLTRARRRRRMNEEAAAAAAAEDGIGTSGSTATPADQTGRKPRSLDEIRNQRRAREPDSEDGIRPSRFLWQGGGGRSATPPEETSSTVPHRLARTGIALPGFDQLKQNSKPKEKSPKPMQQQDKEQDEDSVKIPCEFCMNQFPIEQLMDHQDRCGPNSVSRADELPCEFLDNLLGGTARPAQAAADSAVPPRLSTEETRPPLDEDSLPCEFCEDLFPFDVLIQHQSNCDKNPSRPTSCRQNALAKLNERNPEISTSQPSSTSKPTTEYSARLISEVRRPSRSARSTEAVGGVVDGVGGASTRRPSNEIADKYGLGPSFTTAKLINSSKRESRHKKSQEKEESIEDVRESAKLAREKLLHTSGKILGKQANIDLSGDTNARYHAKIPSIPRGPSGDASGGGAANEAPSASYGDEASDRYLSHRDRMITATRERMGDAAASSRSENWASQVLDNLLDEDPQSTRVKRGGSRDRPTPPPGNGGARPRNGGAPYRPSGFNSPSAKYASKK